ncbi:hypothetical protein FOA52_000427 [Chlamydomonas sp. UWO 241]|nr:hypothetical protein FOA52_000427 [Chlamydomonas sp. UWO 241]
MCQRCNHTTRVQVPHQPHHAHQPYPQPQPRPQQHRPPPAGADTTSRIQCTGCRLLLSYPGGAPSVRCAVCSTVMEVPRYAHVTCGGCRTRLMYPSTAASVRCSVCNHITAAQRAAGGAGPSGAGAGAAGPSGSGPSGGGGRPPAVAPNPSLLTTIGSLQGRDGPGGARVNSAAAAGLEVVMIENPPTKGDDGRETESFMIGIKVER